MRNILISTVSRNWAADMDGVALISENNKGPADVVRC